MRPFLEAVFPTVRRYLAGTFSALLGYKNLDSILGNGSG